MPMLAYMLYPPIIVANIVNILIKIYRIHTRKSGWLSLLYLMTSISGYNKKKIFVICAELTESILPWTIEGERIRFILSLLLQLWPTTVISWGCYIILKINKRYETYILIYWSYIKVIVVVNDITNNLLLRHSDFLFQMIRKAENS